MVDGWVLQWDIATHVLIHLEKGRGGKGDWLSRTPLCAERAQYLNEPCSYTDREIGTWGLEGEVAQWLAALAALAEGLGLVSRGGSRLPVTPAPGGFDALFCFPRVPIHTNTHD